MTANIWSVIVRRVVEAKKQQYNGINLQQSPYANRGHAPNPSAENGYGAPLRMDAHRPSSPTPAMQSVGGVMHEKSSFDKEKVPWWKKICPCIG